MKLFRFFKKMSLHEYIFAICMLAAWVAYLITFVQNPSMRTFIGGGCIFALIFVFFCWTGRKLPTESVWARFTDIAFVTLLVMYVTNLGMALCCYPALESIFSLEFFWLIITLSIIYVLAVIFAVLGIIGYRDER